MQFTPEKVKALEDQVIPMILQAPAMADALRRIADGDHKGAHTFLDPDHHAVMSIEEIKDIARAALRNQHGPKEPRRRRKD